MKIRSILLAVVLGTSLLAVPAQAATQLTVGVAYDIGGRGDKSFNDASAAGLDKAQKQFDFNLEAVVTDGTSADREKRIRSLITKNCNPIIAIGAGYAPTLQALAVEYPSTHFAIINDASVAALNVTSVIFANTQGAYLAGFSAAQVSKSGKVAMIANPDQADIYKDGFSAGVFASKKKVIPIVKYVSGSYSVAANQVIDAGADVVFVATQGSDSEVFKVIVARNAKKKGPNIGLIGSLATFGRVNNLGFIETPYRRVKEGRVTTDVIYLAADEEERYAIAQANAELDSNSHLVGERIYCRKGDGFELVERLRKNGNSVPVLMLSARADRVDVTRGLTLGADDYVVKPFSLEELVLRLKAILRRSQISGMSNTALKCGPISIDDSTHTVNFSDDVIDLSPTEYRLLQVLIENKNRVLSKSVLLDDVWGITFESESTVVDTYISYLRKKLHIDGFDGIKTVRGIGFQIVAD